MSTSPPTDHASPIPLGTKTYWDTTYTAELQNYASDPSDEGTIWFADSNAEQHILKLLFSLPYSRTDEPAWSTDLRVLDLGTGNGHLLCELRKAGWRGEMVGVDYSAASVELARRIENSHRAEEKEGEYAREIDFEVWDALQEEPGKWLGDGFDIVLDKGTFDAVGLGNFVAEDGRSGSEVYAGVAGSLVKDGGYLLVVSCNWTEDELRRWFEFGDMEYFASMSFAKFRFGGSEGQTVSGVCFQRRAKKMDS